jgi:hypothetical protein
LTPQEAVASVARRVRRLEALGLCRGEAIRQTAGEIGIDRDKVRWCVETAFQESPVRISSTTRRRPAVLAVAA